MGGVQLSTVDKSNITTSNGVVTFLDVLGWKGIWQRKQNPIKDLEALVSSIETKSEKLSRGIKSSEDQICSPSTRVMIISDTIVIFTEATSENAKCIIDLHGSVCQEAIPSSIEKGIPIRGATSYGEVILSKNNSIYAGKAIDEAAAWHEAADWIGVFMTPTASFVYESSDDSAWSMHSPPMKDSRKFKTFSVKWHTKEDDKQLQFIKQNFCKLAPITPDIESKFGNTIKYLTG